MLLVNQLIGFGVAASGAAASIALTDSTSDNTNLTTYTFSTRALGTAAANRYIIVGVGSSNLSTGTTISSVTVGGVSGSLVKRQTRNAGGVDYNSELWIAAVPTGTTGDVVVVCSTGNLRCAVGVWRAVDINPTAFQTANSASASANPQSASLDIPANGCAVAYCALDASSSTTTWAGLTEDFDALYETVTNTGSSLNSAAGASALTVSATPSGGVLGASMVCASFSSA